MTPRQDFQGVSTTPRCRGSRICHPPVMSDDLLLRAACRPERSPSACIFVDKIWTRSAKNGVRKAVQTQPKDAIERRNFK